MSIYINISQHAVDRASQRMLEVWLSDCPNREHGLVSWLVAQMRPVVDAHERAGSLADLQFVTVRNVTFVIKHEPERNRVTVPTVFDGNPRTRVPVHVRADKRSATQARQQRERLSAEDSGWTEKLRRGDR